MGASQHHRGVVRVTRGRVGNLPAANHAWDTFRAVLAQAAVLDQGAAEAMAARVVTVLERLVADADSEAIRSATAVVGARRGWGPYTRPYTRACRGPGDGAVTADTAGSTAGSVAPLERGSRRGWAR